MAEKKKRKWTSSEKERKKKRPFSSSLNLKILPKLGICSGVFMKIDCLHLLYVFTFRIWCVTGKIVSLRRTPVTGKIVSLRRTPRK